MLTITTNKTVVADIAAGKIREWTLPITDYWTKRIINLLGFSMSEERDIMHNLREGRAGTCDNEKEIAFTAGGSCSAKVKATVRIESPDGVECFVLKIRDIIETKGLDGEPETVSDQDVEVVGMPNAPAVRTLVKQYGFCKYCNQSIMLNAPEGLSPADLNEMASNECDCDEARRQRERKMKMQAAGAWAEKEFSKQDGQLQVVLCAIRATFEGAIDYVTVKIGKNTHKIDTDSDGMIRIRTTYKDSNEETF